ncbi:MAG: hypothetical protein ABDH31_01010, partial [Chlorobiota bacterium]
IRGALWVSGRVQYVVRLRELDAQGVEMRLTAELSGMEGYITNRVHFWASNGILERQLLQRILELLGLSSEVALPKPPEQQQEEDSW